MVDPNWGLLRPDNGANNALAQGFQLGNGLRQRRQENAMLDLRQQELRQRQETAQQEAQRKQQEQRRADMPMVSKLLDFAAQGEPQYRQALQIAQQYGIDVSGAPQAFDLPWIDQQRTVLKTLSDPTKMEALSTAGKAAVDMGYKPGTPEFNKAVNEIWAAGESKPYVVGGETRLYTPKVGGPGQVQGGPQAGAIEDGYRFKGGNPADPNAWEPVGQGGPAAAPQTPFAGAFADFPARP